MNTTPGPGSLTIAVVDDDQTSRALLERILSRSGYRVVVYDSGEAILQAVATASTDLVCLDMSLPGMNGLETLRRLKELRPALPVVVFTGSAEEVRPSALAAGADRCVDKTAPWSELSATIASIIG